MTSSTSSSPVWFDESRWATAKIANLCHIAFNSAKQGWSRATTKEEAGAGVPVPVWHEPCCLSYIQKTTCYHIDLHVTKPRHKEGTSLLIETCFCAPQKHVQNLSGSWQRTGAWALFFHAVIPIGIDTLRLHLHQQISQSSRSRGPCWEPCISGDLAQMSSILV